MTWFVIRLETVFSPQKHFESAVRCAVAVPKGESFRDCALLTKIHYAGMSD